MLSRVDIRNYIEGTLGMSASHHTKYADRYDTGYHPFYLKSSNVRPLVIHPEIKNDIILNISHGLELDELYYNSALSRFPRLAGPGREPCGYDIDVADIATLASLLGQIGATTGSPGYTDIIKDIDGARSTFNTLPATEREALISARLGQGLFRTRLMSVWKGRCAVTDIQIPALLRASHIKPWRMSDNSERLDPENGLLLVANLDAAFDAGLLSFTDTGRMLFSATLGAEPDKVLGISIGSSLTQCPKGKQRDFLKHHRDRTNFR